MTMQTSERGIAYIESIEGVVLKAYRDAVGKWTIGGGLTAASGVIDPKPGMVITRAEATRLMMLALRRNYEPAVNRAMPGASQHEFDAGSSFQWNTGAAERASWLKVWRLGPKTEAEWSEVKRLLLAWNKGGGRVLPGLTRRRTEEFSILRHGIYPSATVVPPDHDGMAGWAVRLTVNEIGEIRAGFGRLGYRVGPSRSGVDAEAVRAFQKDHDLTVDGIIGKATLSTLQRRLDAARKAKTTGTGGAVAGAGSIEATDAIGLPDWLLWAALVVLTLVLLRLAWNYRDVIAAKVQRVLPGVTRFLRRF